MRTNQYGTSTRQLPRYSTVRTCRSFSSGETMVSVRDMQNLALKDADKTQSIAVREYLQELAERLGRLLRD